VIVVDDSSEDGTDLLLEQWSRQYAHLYHTFVPRGARVLSSKKLALTIGIKAAHHEHILLTDADCRPESRNWIREMMSGFANEKTEIVLGFSPYFEKKGLLNRIICYDTLFNGLQYMGMALSGHPYMGVGRNMAYKRNTFFETGGFKGLLSNRAGDDDLFVNRVATKHNTAVVCNVDSLVWSLPKTSWTEWLHQKRRHLSVSPLYRTGSKLRIGIEPLSRGLLYAGILASLIIGNMVAIAGVLALYLLRLLLQLILINIANKRLGMRAIGLGIVIFDIILPILTCYILITQPLQKKPLYW
jgi:cellulose synthase/poly-beta-1,6-N-acetylglucosamine synthase-like glycosyltransferase